MAVVITVHPTLETLLAKIGSSKIGHPLDGTRSFIMSNVQAEFDLIAGATAGTQDIAVLLRLRSSSTAETWPFATEPSATFNFANIVGDV